MKLNLDQRITNIENVNHESPPSHDSNTYVYKVVNGEEVLQKVIPCSCGHLANRNWKMSQKKQQ